MATTTATNGHTNGVNGTKARGRAPLHLPAEESKTTRRTVKKNVEVKIPDTEVAEVAIRIHGSSPLLINAFSNKAIEEMLGKQMGAAKARSHKDPEKCFQEAKYLNDKKQDCIPSIHFKKAMVNAASFAKGTTKVQLRGAFFVLGQLIPLEFKKCVNRRDVVRVGGFNKTADVRFRPEYHDWSCVLIVRYVTQILTLDKVVQYLKLAGQCVGVGEWRPQKDGYHGTFEIGEIGNAKDLVLGLKQLGLKK